MTIKKKRTKIILPSILTVSLTCGLLLTGCQKTPDQSAVVSKAGGLSEDVIADPLKDGETQTLNLPEHWDTTVTWSNDRGVFHADQKLESVTTGNLPVIEVSQKKLELEQLNGLISYFAGGEILYQTQELTSEYYQNLLDRIKNREGFYADNSVEYDLTGLEKLVEEVLPLAPEQTPLQEIGQIEYTSKKTDPAYEAKRKSLEAYGYDFLPDTTKQDGMEIHFQATVGADAKGTINAETYDPEAGNYSIFSWSEGNGIELATIENTLARENLTTDYGVPAGSVKESFMEKLQTLKDRMEETALLEETAEDEAEKVLKDLNLENMQLLSSDKILWYAQSDYPEATILEHQESLWNADPNLGKTGYRLTYVPSVSGLKINQDKSGYPDDSGFAYAPSMPVEQIYIVVTEDGIRSFKWKGMSQEELHSRYAWFLINRIGKRNYIWMKSFGVAFTGGAISVSAAGIALVVFIVICRNIPTLNTLQNISEVISITGIGFIRLFLNGALWSLCGSLTAVLTKNKYLSCAVPFILYYVLTVFQERYYRNYFFLSPKQWASPAYYGNGFCLLALLLISSLLALALRKCVVRRVVA